MDDRLTKAELFDALEKASQLVLYSVDPECSNPEQATGLPQFMYFSVLGSAEISGSEKLRLVEAFEDGIDEKKNGVAAKCFEPHHGLLARVDGKEYRAIICYKCDQVRARRVGQKSENNLELLTTDSPNSIFARVCADHNLPVK